MDIVLSARDVSAHRHRRVLVRGVSFDLRAGQVLGVVGANGSGKTTLLRTLIGFIPPSAGEVRLDGRVPPGALREAPTAYFGGEATLFHTPGPGWATRPAGTWGRTISAASSSTRTPGRGCWPARSRWGRTRPAG